MEFFKKNWLKLVGIAALTVAGVFALVASINAFCTAGSLNNIPEPIRAGMPFDAMTSQAMGGAFIYLAIFMSSLFIVTHLIMGMCCNKHKKFKSISFLVCSTVAMVMFIVGIALAADFLSSLDSAIDAARVTLNEAQTAYAATGGVGMPLGGAEVQLAQAGLDAARTAYTVQIAQTLGHFIAFGFLPVAFAIKKVICSCKKDKEAVSE